FDHLADRRALPQVAGHRPNRHQIERDVSMKRGEVDIAVAEVAIADLLDPRGRSGAQAFERRSAQPVPRLTVCEGGLVAGQESSQKRTGSGKRRWLTPRQPFFTSPALETDLEARVAEDHFERRRHDVANDPLASDQRSVSAVEILDD